MTCHGISAELGLLGTLWLLNDVRNWWRLFLKIKARLGSKGAQHFAVHFGVYGLLVYLVGGLALYRLLISRV